MTGCKKNTYFDIDFIVQNNCAEKKVDHTIRIYSSIDNNYLPEYFSDLINQRQSLEFYIKDSISDDRNIENVFYKLDIIK